MLSMDGCNIFREELAIRYPTHGHALWEPDPGGLYEAVEVGDVGFIRNGYFYRLFNALLPRDSPSDSDSSHGPRYPPQLKPKNPHHIRKIRDNHQHFYSKNVTKQPHYSDFHATGPDDVTFSCSERRGALLCLPFPADHEETVAHGDFSKWIVKNVDDCLRVAEDLGCGVNRMEDIILVTGRHLARSWISVAFSESLAGAQVSFNVRASGNSSVHLEERDVRGGELKLGPSGENLPENQCIFVQGYRVVRILNFWPRIRAAGSTTDLHEPEPDSDKHLVPIGIPSEADDPLHVLSEYIAEQAPECDMVLVHDNDLGFIGDALQADTLIEHVRNHAPAIQQVRCELILGNESKSGAEATIVKLATISQGLFETLREDQSDLECPHPMDTTRGSDSGIPWSMLKGNASPQSSDLLSLDSSPTQDVSVVATLPSPTRKRPHSLPTRTRLPSLPTRTRLPSLSSRTRLRSLPSRTRNHSLQIRTRFHSLPTRTRRHSRPTRTRLPSPPVQTDPLPFPSRPRPEPTAAPPPPAALAFPPALPLPRKPESGALPKPAPSSSQAPIREVPSSGLTGSIKTLRGNMVISPAEHCPGSNEDGIDGELPVQAPGCSPKRHSATRLVPRHHPCPPPPVPASAVDSQPQKIQLKPRKKKNWFQKHVWDYSVV